MKRRKNRISTVIKLPAWLFILGASLIAVSSCSTENTPVYTLTTNVSPAEAGSVSPDQGEYDKGTEVQVSASANEHWVFTGWGGDYSGSTNPATIMMDDDKSLSALFEKKEYALTVNIEGEGTVEERLVNAKSTDYPAESVVELTAVPAGGWEFTGWDESLSGQENPETVTINSPVSVTAMFEKVVNVIVEGEGDVQVEYIDEETGKRKSASRRVRLTATPQEGWKFVSWEGDLTGSENPIETTFDEEMTVDAVFVSDEGRWILQGRVTNRPISSVHFTNQNTGWLSTSDIPFEESGSIFHTNDGGQTWSEQYKAGNVREFFYDLEFADENNGWALIGAYPFGEEVNWYGKILHTSNGGQSWSEQYYFEDAIAYSLELVNSNTIIVVGEVDINKPELGEHGVIISSNNGGSSWTQQSVSDDPEMHLDVDFSGDDNGWMTGMNGLYKTGNGGNSWSIVSDHSFSRINFVNGSIGWGVKFDFSNHPDVRSQIFKTTNGGQSWSEQRSISGFAYIYFVNSELGWMGTDNGTIQQTTDGGETWNEQQVYDNGNPVSVSDGVGSFNFVDSQTGWVSVGGSILRYSQE
ncbi:InlB B-repeat-containing protein [Rhodohalobacter sulfatireducens]|uniref:Bacterial repeat domain-containing protein n=1 Tax=Rhodohalobacter sulfatireducens TaxID=2911366 RepID=A0ABS9KAY0_9BACT|nr:hypothetical protein [Rhodohalobacter sulfatireducens]MCG2587985.1 hypothetical protein [Rhodohalobacter sulfatireducens]